MWELREPRDLRVAVAVWELREPTAKICFTGINISHFYHGLYLQTCRFRQKMCKKVILVIFSVRVE